MSEPTIELVADGGQLVRLFDVVDGNFPELVEPLLAMHLRGFENYDYVRKGIRRDAVESSVRDGIVVHQFVLCVDDNVCGFSLVDTNLVRNVAPNHFLYVDADQRSVTINGKRLGTWFLHHTNEQVIIDGAVDSWGAVCEADSPRAKIFLPHGWVVLEDAYDEPNFGWAWPTNDISSFRHNLLWLPRPGANVDELKPKVRDAAAAAFLLDMYQLRTDEPLAERQCGAELDRPGPKRR
jgi:hypothetical protein